VEQAAAIPGQTELVYTACDCMASISPILEDCRLSTDSRDNRRSEQLAHELIDDSHQQKLQLIILVLESGRSIRLTALGSSMLPSIWPGDVLLIESARSQQFEPGDVVVIRESSGLLIHRLICKNGCWITRGDAMPQDDPPVRPGDVLGKVTKICRGTRAKSAKPLNFACRFIAFALCHSQLLRNLTLRLRLALNRSPAEALAEEIRTSE